MILDKAIILKGLAGVAAVGGIAATGGFVFKDQIKGAFSDSPQDGGEEKPGQNQGDSVQSDPVTPSNPTAKDSGAIVGGVGAGSPPSAPLESTVDSLGIPNKCTAEGSSAPCSLGLDDLKKIKFEGLEGDVTVEPSSTPSITLTIETTGTKKYKFNNSGTQITLKKAEGQGVTVVLDNGESQFTVESGVLKKFVVQPQSPVAVSQATNVDSRGIPNNCISSNQCTLAADDLKKIKFEGLDENGDVTVEPSSGQVTLKIGSSTPKIYTFTNSSTSPITLKNGQPNKKVVLDVGDTEFKEQGNKLKSYEESSFSTINNKLATLNLPNKCRFKSSDKDRTTKECDVTVDELQKIEFENKDTSKNLEITGTSEPIKLEIKMLKSSNDAQQYGSSLAKDNYPRITFKNETSKITIKGKDNASIVIPKGSNTEFLMNEENKGGVKLSKYQKSLGGSLPPSWGILCNKQTSPGSNKYDCTPYQTNTSIRFFSDSSTFQEIKASEQEQNKKIFIAEENIDDYNLGFKFEVNELITSDSLSLVKNDTYEIKYSSNKWGFFKKTPA